MGAFQFVAGWWGHQPGRRAVGGVPPLTISLAVRQIEMHPSLFILRNISIATVFTLCNIFKIFRRN